MILLENPKKVSLYSIGIHSFSCNKFRAQNTISIREQREILARRSNQKLLKALQNLTNIQPLKKELL